MNWGGGHNSHPPPVYLHRSEFFVRIVILSTIVFSILDSEQSVCFFFLSGNNFSTRDFRVEQFFERIFDQVG